MDKVYDFGWLIQEIDDSIILKLVNEDKTMGIYQVSEIKNIVLENIQVNFAIVNDLINFIKHSIIRFRDVNNGNNIIDVPIYKFWLLFLNSNLISEDGAKKISLSELDATAIYDKKILNGGCFVYSYKVAEESEELKDIMDIAYNFGYYGMQETIDALNKVNIINYHMANNANNKRA